jgi:hypothetical protein
MNEIAEAGSGLGFEAFHRRAGRIDAHDLAELTLPAVLQADPLAELDEMR